MIVLLLMGFTFLGHFNRVSISVAGSERFISPDGLTKVEMGRVYSAFLLVYTIGMLPGGWLIDRLGPKFALTAMGLGMGLCVVLTGMLGWLGLAVAALLMPLLVIRGMAGAMSMPLHPAAARSVSLWVPLRGRSAANGLVTAGALVGIALTYPGFGWLMDHFDWPLAFVVCGGVLIAFTWVWYVLAADNPAAHPQSNAAEQHLASGGLDTPARTTGTVKDLLGMLGNRSLILLTLSYGALGYFQYLFFYWIEFYLNDELHLPKSESREAAFTVTIAMAVGMALGGWVSDLACRLFGRRRGCLGIALVGMGMSAVFGCLGIATADPQKVVWCFSLSMGSLGLCEGIFWTTAPLLANRNGGLACAFLNTGGNAGGMIAPAITPWLAERYDWTTAIVVACSVCAVGGIMWLGIRPPRDGQ
jgi:sugar phosphate permease